MQLQAKLKVTQPNDEYEHEADRVADQVMRMPEPEVPGGAVDSRPPQPATMSPIVHDVLRSPGQPLDAETREFMEARFGHDFSNVRVHTDEKAGASARAVNAVACTVGRDIVFGAEQYSPGTSATLRLLGHELAYVARSAPRGLIYLFPEEAKEGSEPEPGELAVPPFPTATVILVGSPTDPATGYDQSPYNFSNAAVKAVPKLRTDLLGTDVTVLYFSSGYKLRGQAVHKRALKDLRATGATVVEVTGVDQVISFLNTGLVSPADSTPTRAVKISRFLYFGHGTSGGMLLNWGWGKESHSLSKDEVLNIKSEAFEPAGESYMFTCHVAEGEDSFMSVWASHLGQTAFGPQGNAAFNASYKASSLEKVINKELPKWFLGMPYMNRVKKIDPKDETRE